MANGKPTSIQRAMLMSTRYDSAICSRRKPTRIALGEPVQIKASNAPAFKAGKALKEAVN